MAKCNTQAHDMATTTNNWRTPGTSDPGRYNTPPLREDLVPRSRMAPEENGRVRKEVKLSCFFDKGVKPKNLAWLNKMREKEYNEDERSGKHYVRQGTRNTAKKDELK